MDLASVGCRRKKPNRCLWHLPGQHSGILFGHGGCDFHLESPTTFSSTMWQCLGVKLAFGIQLELLNWQVIYEQAWCGPSWA